MATRDPFHVVPAMIQARADSPPPHPDPLGLGPLPGPRAFRLALARLLLARLALTREGRRHGRGD